MIITWKRIMPGVYRNRTAPRVEIKTYCECGRNCMMRWAVYVDDQALESHFYCTYAEAKEGARAVVVGVAVYGEPREVSAV